MESKLGDDRTGGMYYKDGRFVVTVTDEEASQTVREAGGTPELVTRSKAELASVHQELDELEGLRNAAWGADASTNQVSVEIFDGAPADSREKIETVAAAHPGAIRVERIEQKLSFKATDLRGANGIVSQGHGCSAGFNTKNSSGAIYTLTAGHCVPGTGNTWVMEWNSATIGKQTAWGFSGPQGDWATIRANADGINPLGTVRYHGGVYKQVDRSRFPAQGEDIDRVGVTSQDTTGRVTKQVVTVDIDGVKLKNMFESDVCALGGDSGGPALRGTTALGLLSGGTDETRCTSSSSGTYRNYFTPVQRVLEQRGLRVY
ncbi:S1 family peptidase [Streptomyces albus subsp. chlorinus]|uniref:S1 family peptidase n=1 Tax=Streptomyces albus TaxID=1888 RepID=UPI00156FC87A|nr:S1 family peptidase [Streptomyces albus]NSC20539.1 S1 family peptidase [Streptomyces albus subsp. chlorinus]